MNLTKYTSISNRLIPKIMSDRLFIYQTRIKNL